MRHVLLICLSLVIAARDVSAADLPPCQVHVILFVPSDMNTPAGYQQRIDQIVGYSESFFDRELKRWGYDKCVMPFRKSADGHVEVMVIRGKEKAAQYKPVEVRAEVMDGFRKQNRLGPGRQIWWMFVYAGDPPARFPGYLGGFGPEIGGWSVCNFDTSPGTIDPKALLGSDFLEKLTLKGMIHELGHGFQLPHIGPLRSDDAGNTLMGPTHHNFRRVVKTPEDRVYLCQAEAALLSNHPAFRGRPHNPGKLPQVNVPRLTVTTNARQRSFVVSGQVRANQRAIYALVADESEARPGEYWTKTYVSNVDRDGSFEVTVTEPSESNGTLKVWFAFEDGDQTGDGKSRGRDSGVSRSYTYRQRQWKFQ